MTDCKQLAYEARQGSKEAFAQLYQAVYQDLYRFALYVLKNPEDAQDAVAETVADAYAEIKKLRDSEAFKGWIFKILSNKCKRKLKEYTAVRTGGERAGRFGPGHAGAGGIFLPQR